MTARDICFIKRDLKLAKEYHVLNQFKFHYRELADFKYEEDGQPYSAFSKCCIALYRCGIFESA